MAAPTISDIPFYKGLNGVPANDTDPIIGNIDTGSAITGSPDTVINSPEVAETELVLYGGFYVKNVSTGNLANARISNRAGSILNSSAGVMQVISSSSEDVDIFVRGTGYSAAALDTDDVDITGQSPNVGVVTWDEEGALSFECLDEFSAPVTPVGNVTISINGEVVGVIYGSNKPSVSCNRISSLFEMAVATSKNTNISAADRLTAPTGIGSFFSAVKWAGNDSSVPFPSNNLDGGESLAVCVKLTIPEEFPIPVAGSFRFLPYVVGNAEA